MRELREALEAVDAKLREAINEARKAKTLARSAGGEVSRVVGGGLDLYLIPMLRAFVNEKDQPGSLAEIFEMLDEEEKGEDK